MTNEASTAAAFLTARNFPAARRIIERILEREPDAPAGHALLIDYEMAQGNMRRARELCDTALARWPDAASIRVNHIVALMHRRPWLVHCWDVQARLRRFGEDFPQRREERLLLEGICAIKSNRRGRARRIRDRLAAEFPAGWGASMLDRQLANLLDDTLLRDAAARTALERDPAEAEAHAELAVARFDQCRFLSARRSARAALALDPTCRRARAVLRLTWLMLIPPFLMKQAMTSTPAILRDRVKSRTARFAIWCGLFYAALKVDVAGMDYRTLLVWILLMLAWEPLRMIVMRRGRHRRKPAKVRLARY